MTAVVCLQSGRHAGHRHVSDASQAGGAMQEQLTEAQGLLLHHAGWQPDTAPDSSWDHADSGRPQAGAEYDPQGQAHIGKSVQTNQCHFLRL